LTLSRLTIISNAGKLEFEHATLHRLVDPRSVRRARDMLRQGRNIDLGTGEM
jgi:hypothetical protein